jgi:hypothetical protein
MQAAATEGWSLGYEPSGLAATHIVEWRPEATFA